MTETTKGPAGLGGWLAVVALGLFVAPLRLLLFIATTFWPLLRDGTWLELTTPGFPAYNSLWAPILIFEFLANIGLVAMLIYLGVLFFRKSRSFPQLFMWVIVANIGIIVLDAWLGTFVMPDAPMLDPDTAKELARATLGATVWIPYMLMSKRVKNTFVN